MDDHAHPPAALSRITCIVPHPVSAQIVDRLRALGIRSVLTENGRSVRRRRERARFPVSRRTIRTEDSPVDLYRFTVPRDQTRSAMDQLIEAGELDVPGRGTVYAQDVDEYVNHEASALNLTSPVAAHESAILRDLALITCILSRSGSAEYLAALALELGTGVPVVTIGTGTGMRDRLGLLRITVPPEKELVHLLVPALDAEGLMRQLLEEGRLSGPGRGFVYCASVREGLLDTRLQIGPQEHAASMEQVVAAIDKLYAGTAWRRRFVTLERGAGSRLVRDRSEIAIVCAEERSEVFVRAALRAGGGGATSARVRHVYLNEAVAGDAARERCIITVPTSIRDRVVASVMQAGADSPEWLNSVQVLPSPFAYAYQRASS